jgi:histidinol-phosphatase (PHP family)
MVDYHTHTALCGHATGTIEEYVEAAIARSLAEIGFADHAPLPEGMREGITMRADEVERYISMVGEARRSFGDRIKIKTGLEVDFPFFDAFDRKYLSDPRIDYLIGSCHFLGDWPFDHDAYVERFAERDIDDIYNEYFGILAALIESGAFDIIGHFDVVKKFGHRPRGNFDDVIGRLARGCASHGIAVELNTAGLRKPVREIYPSPKILGTLFRENVAVTLGSDSHAPGEIAHEFPRALEILRKIGYRKISGFASRRRYELPI